MTFYNSLPKSTLRNRVDNALDSLQENPVGGDRIRLDLWPTKYVKKYGVNNLYRYGVGSDWRLIYTLAGNKENMTCVILDALDHKKYDNLFGYKTS